MPNGHPERLGFWCVRAGARQALKVVLVVPPGYFTGQLSALLPIMSGHSQVSTWEPVRYFALQTKPALRL